MSRIIKSANMFFRTLAGILFIYVIALAILYPMFARQSFSYAYTATLIVILSISLFVQYYFGIVNCLLLSADTAGLWYSDCENDDIANLPPAAVHDPSVCQKALSYQSKNHLYRGVLKQKWNGRAACDCRGFGWYGYRDPNSIYIAFDGFHLFRLLPSCQGRESAFPLDD